MTQMKRISADKINIKLKNQYKKPHSVIPECFYRESID